MFTQNCNNNLFKAKTVAYTALVTIKSVLTGTLAIGYDCNWDEAAGTILQWHIPCTLHPDVHIKNKFFKRCTLKFLFIDLRERERNSNLLFHLFMPSLVASCSCPDWRLNPHLWHMGMILQPTDLPGQDQSHNGW